MKDLFGQIYDGILRFSPLRKYFHFRSGQRGSFPLVGFLDIKKKAELEKILNHNISKPEYFEQALIHRSYLQVLNESNVLSNERLEFLGDSILGMVIAEYLFSLHTNVPEGELTKMRSWLVNKKSLAICSTELKLDGFIMMSFSATKSLENGSDSIMSDALESIIGAIYLDSNLETVKKFIINSLLPIMIDNSVMVDENFKSLLLEKVQGIGKNAPRYEVIDEFGPDHNKVFTVGAYVGKLLVGTGSGKSKKEAEQFAAKKAMEYKF